MNKLIVVFIVVIVVLLVGVVYYYGQVVIKDVVIIIVIDECDEVWCIFNNQVCMVNIINDIVKVNENDKQKIV